MSIAHAVQASLLQSQSQSALSPIDKIELKQSKLTSLEAKERKLSVEYQDSSSIALKLHKDDDQKTDQKGKGVLVSPKHPAGDATATDKAEVTPQERQRPASAHGVVVLISQSSHQDDNKAPPPTDEGNTSDMMLASPDMNRANLPDSTGRMLLI